MSIRKVPLGRVSLIALALAMASVGPVSADPVNFTGGADDTDNSWTNSDNWSSNSPPTISDDVTVDSSLNGAVIVNGETEKIHSLILNGGLNVNDGGKLVVGASITNNGVDHAYFINDGIIAVQQGSTVGTLFNTFTNGDDIFGYIGNMRKFTANVDNSGAVINGGEGADAEHVIWLGDVDNRSGGEIDNISATWRGDVHSNFGAIYNQGHATWIGDVSNGADAMIQNDSDSVWKGDVSANAGLINNLEDAVWQGDIVANTNSINNDGGVWKGDVLSNAGTIFSTNIWLGDMTSSGELWLSGTMKGAITNAGGVVHVYDPLRAVTAFINNGALDMADGAADDTLEAETWSGTGTAMFDFDTASGQADHIVLSGDYTADTQLEFNLVGARGRALGDVQLISVGGDKSGSLDVNLPSDGVISYHLVESDDGWRLTTSLSAAPQHAAAAIAFVQRVLTSAQQIAGTPDDSCDGVWMRGLGGGQAGNLAGTPSSLGLGGVQLGTTLGCASVNGGRLSFGITGGVAAGPFALDFGDAGALSGDFAETFAGAYGDFTAGALRVALQGQVGLTRLSMSDPDTGLDSASLFGTGVDFSGSASYELALGEVSLTPELGFAASNGSARSDNFADVGTMTLSGSRTLDVHAGATVAGKMALANGAVLAPFASASVHDAFAPDNVVFTDGAGGTADVPTDGLGSYLALGFGATLAHAGDAATRFDAGLRADLKLGPNVSENALGGYARVSF